MRNKTEGGQTTHQVLVLIDLAIEGNLTTETLTFTDGTARTFCISLFQ